MLEPKLEQEIKNQVKSLHFETLEEEEPSACQRTEVCQLTESESKYGKHKCLATCHWQRKLSHFHRFLFGEMVLQLYLGVYHEHMDIRCYSLEMILQFVAEMTEMSMTVTLSQFFEKQYCWICPPKYKWLPLEIFNVASDIHLCSSIVFTCQSRGWICL